VELFIGQAQHQKVLISFGGISGLRTCTHISTNAYICDMGEVWSSIVGKLENGDD
jgi:RecB family exonuclease